MNKLKHLTGLILALTYLTPLVAQESYHDRVSVPFTDPSRPGVVEVGLIHGAIEVKAHDGKEVIVEARVRDRKYSKSKQENASGLKRLAIVSTGLTIEEERNVMSVEAASHTRTIDILLRVPRKTSLQLSTVNSGHLRIEGVEGEMELNNVNGSIEAIDVSGSVVANTTNGSVVVTFDKVTPDVPMSFASFNGKVDVTLPKGLAATLKMKSDRGEVYSDFDIDIKRDARVSKEDTRAEGGRYRLEVESAIYGDVNGGGPEYHFSTFNGTIYIRKSQ